MNVSSDVATIPGWYGKLPSLGDFASRRLEADFVEPWDLWLAGAMQVHRQSLGDGWVEAYLDSPPWRFLLSPGVLHSVDSAQVFAGVLLPSVDRVGRYFPLTIAASLARVPASAAEFEALLAWLHRLEDTALDALQGDWSIDELEQALADLGTPGGDAGHAAVDRLAAARSAVAAAVASGGGFIDIAGVASRAELASLFLPPSSGAMAGALSPTPHGVAFWIDDSPGRPHLLVSEGLPGHDDFARMFGGGGDAGRGAAARSAPIPDDPLVTLPQPFDPLATLPQPFDPLATLPRPLDAAIAVATRHDVAVDTDLLGLFQGSTATAPSADAPQGRAGDGDILALFGAADDAVPFEPGEEEAPKKDDILALFEVAPDSSPTPLSAEPATPHEAPPKEQDILDMFGGAPTAPDHGKGH